MLTVLLVCAVLLIYSRSLRGEFLTDDFAILDMEELHRKFSRGLYRPRRFNDLLHGARPLTHWGYYWTWRIAGLRPWGFHVGNVLIHLVNTFLVFRLGELLGQPGDKMLLAAAVFAVHPLQVPAVAWISGRAGLQSTMFSYAAAVLLLTGFWPLALISQYLAQRSKEDAWVYMTAWPVLIWAAWGN